MTEAPRPIVVDTSVAVKFYLPEEFMEDARKLRDTVKEGNFDMVAPGTIQPEFWNVLWQKRRRDELSPEEARSIWDEFAEDPVSLYKPEDLMPRAVHLTRRGDGYHSGDRRRPSSPGIEANALRSARPPYK